MTTDATDINRGWNRVEYSEDGGRKGAVRVKVKAAMLSMFAQAKNHVVVALVNVSYWGVVAPVG
jgi:hypothetical protein